SSARLLTRPVCRGGGRTFFCRIRQIAPHPKFPLGLSAVYRNRLRGRQPAGPIGSYYRAGRYPGAGAVHGAGGRGDHDPALSTRYSPALRDVVLPGNEHHRLCWVGIHTGRERAKIYSVGHRTNRVRRVRVLLEGAPTGGVAVRGPRIERP